ncbi:MAG: hypothetical protein R3A52_21305 [Polyangiales bacterium]
MRRSLCRSRQEPMQSVEPAVHEVTHVPPEQTCPTPQALSQAPQWARSVCESRHAPEHAVCPGTQVSAHMPPEQISSAAQTLPHAPQLSRSVWVFAQ